MAQKRGGLLIYGAGGFAREVAWLARDCAAAGTTPMPVAFVVDTGYPVDAAEVDLPVLDLSTALARHPDATMVVAVGSGAAREAMVERAREAGARFETLVHPRVERSSRLSLGEGTLVCAGNLLTVDIVVGRHVHVNLGCTVGHDVHIEDFATLAPGVHVSGRVRIARGVYIGTGAVILEGSRESPLVIGPGAVVGAGACVTRSVDPGVTVVGVPARPS